MKKEQNLNNAETQALNIPIVINRLFDLRRFDIDPQWNGEFTELEAQPEADGKYVRWEDVRKLITDIRVSNGL